jgi:hypothetical protein
MSQNFLENRILLKYSDTDERATVIDPDLENFEIPKKQKQIIKNKNKNKKIKRQRKGLAINNNKIEIRIPGYKGIQLLPVLELVHFIPIFHIQSAAKKFLRQGGATKLKKNFFYKSTHL